MLPRRNRLLQKRDFDLLYRSGRFINSNFFKVSFLKTETKGFRAGVVVSTKVSKSAVERNRIRRTVYGICGEFLKEFENLGCILVFVAKRSVVTIGRELIEEDVKVLLGEVKDEKFS